MNAYNKKTKQLGMNVGTATHRLRKMLLYEFARRLDLLICYRCGNRIESIDDFSIEHKEAWQDSPNPVELFFDLDNVAFSHLNCNIRNSRNGLRPNKGQITHGTYTAYHYHKCRCILCKKAYASKRKEWPSRKGTAAAKEGCESGNRPDC